jgi:hypothetical protein
MRDKRSATSITSGSWPRGNRSSAAE